MCRETRVRGQLVALQNHIQHQQILEFFQSQQMQGNEQSNRMPVEMRDIEEHGLRRDWRVRADGSVFSSSKRQQWSLIILRYVTWGRREFTSGTSAAGESTERFRFAMT